MALLANLPLRRKPSVMPGYGLTLGYTLTYLSLIVLIPLAGLLLRPVGLGWQGFWNVVSAPRVVFPAILPALLTGVALAFARGVGEYGSVIFIAGNMPMISEIAPLLIVVKLEQYDYAGAAAVGVAMLLISFLLLLLINLLQRWKTAQGSTHG